MKFYKYFSTVLFIVSIYLAYTLYNFKIDRNEIVTLQEATIQKSMQINDLLSEIKKMKQENAELVRQIGRIHSKREEMILKRI